MTHSSNCHIALAFAGKDLRLELTGKSSWTIGRSRQNDLTVPDGNLSRRHAIIQGCGGNRFTIIDLGSRNGTYVDDVRANAPIELTNGANIVLSGVRARFIDPGSEESSGRTKAYPMLTSEVTMLDQRRQLISVLVVDLHNFTGLVQRLGDQVAAQVMGAWFSEITEVLKQRQRWSEKFIGDAVMAIWNHDARSDIRQDLRQMFLTISEIRELTDKITRKFELSPALQIGVGINTGHALLGHESVVGDTINKTFRLESVTRQAHAEVVVGQSTHGYLQVAGIDTACFESKRMQLKGYQKEERVYTTSVSGLKRLAAQGLS